MAGGAAVSSVYGDAVRDEAYKLMTNVGLSILAGLSWHAMSTA